jgi:YidC/Oxa1 family membrane protein insertase
MDNQRLILFIVFSFSLLLLWEAWQDRHAPATVAPTATTTSATSAPPTPSQALNAPAATSAQTSFAKGQRAVVETDVLRATIDANGGDLRQLQLLSHRETEDKNLVFTLFEDSQTRPYLAQSGLVGQGLPTHRTRINSIRALSPGHRSGATGSAAGVEDPPPACGRKTIFSSAATTRSRSKPASSTAALARRPHAVLPVHRHGEATRGSSFSSDLPDRLFIPTPINSESRVQGRQEGRPISISGRQWLGGVVQHHFVSAWLPGQPSAVLYLRSAACIRGVIWPRARSRLVSKAFTVPLYAGLNPDLLEKTAPGLELARDYGWLTRWPTRSSGRWKRSSASSATGAGPSSS